MGRPKTASVAPDFEKPRNVQPWEKQFTESDKAWHAFKTYRDLGSERSCTKVADAVGKSWQLMEQWCKKYKWRERIQLFEMHEDRLHRKERRAGILKMANRQVKIAVALQDKVIGRLKKVDVNSLSISELLRMLTVGVKIEYEGRRIPSKEVIPDMSMEEPEDIDPDEMVKSLESLEPEDDLGDADDPDAKDVETDSSEDEPVVHEPEAPSSKPTKKPPTKPKKSPPKGVKVVKGKGNVKGTKPDLVLVDEGALDDYLDGDNDDAEGNK